jgi:transcription termination factor Rho
VTQTSEATASGVAETSSVRPKKSGGLSSMLLPELKQLASSLGIKGTGAMRKSALVDAISAARSAAQNNGASQQADQASGRAPRDERARARQTVQAEPDTSASSAEPTTAPFTTDEMNGHDDGDARLDSPSADDQSRDAGRDAQQDREARSDQGRRVQARSRDRNRDTSSRSDTDQDRDARNNGSQVVVDNSRPGRESARDVGSQDRESTRDVGAQDRDGNRDAGQREGQQRDGQPGRDGYRDDDRGGSRNSRRRNRNRDRFRDRDKRRDGNDAEPQVSEDDILIPAAGILDLLDNYAFVRTTGYLPGPNDVYVALSMVRKYGLRKGDAITGAVRQQAADGERREKFNPMVRIDTVNGAEPEASKNRIEFSKLVPLYAQERLRLETEPTLLASRIIDIVAPIGKGQRGLIVSPSKAGKTLILQAMANAITTNNPECHLMVVLVDERPEEVTDMQRAVKGEVIASTFDRPAEDHTTVAELAIERAKRLVELGHDVVVLLDSITRLGRAYNLAAPASGRILSGGVDSSALYPPKRFFGAARNIEDGGSLTILATALIETGSKMDEVIFEEFKGTGNMELRLRREYADKRIFPAIDVDASGTRREDLLMSKDELQIVWKLRRVLSALDGQQALELLLEKLRQTKSNVEFLMQVNKTTPTASGLRNSGED